VPRYELLVDGRRRHRAVSADETRTWLRGYRVDHADDDPDAAHVQVRQLSRISWLTGGKLVPREQFLDDEPPRAVSD